jgi:hypothetical protein
MRLKISPKPVTVRRTRQVIVAVNQPEINFDALLQDGIGEPPGDASGVRLIGDLFANLRQGVLPIRLLGMCEQLCMLPHEMHPEPEKVT